MNKQPENKQNIFITGASGGIGTALVYRLDELGFRVFAGTHHEEDGQILVRSTNNTVPINIDITDEKSIAKATEIVEHTVGGEGLHGLVNLAGIIVQGPLELIPIDSLQQQFEVNVMGQMAITQAFLPALRTVKSSVVVNVGAVTGRIAAPFAGAISASKAALASLTDVLRMELKPFGVDVVLIEPGAMQTEIFDKATQRYQEDLNAAPTDVRTLYASAVETVDETQANLQKQANSVDVAVKAIISALTDRKPKTRYLAGLDARILALLKHFPDRWRDRLLMRAMGLKDELFQ